MNLADLQKDYCEGCSTPPRGRPLKPCQEPVDERVSKRVKYNLIRFAKSRRAA